MLVLVYNIYEMFFVKVMFVFTIFADMFLFWVLLDRIIEKDSVGTICCIIALVLLNAALLS